MSDICRAYSCKVMHPLEIDLRVEMTDGGLIDHIEGETFDDMAEVDDIRVIRAVLFLTPAIQTAQCRGDLLEDVLKALPTTADFEVERSILTCLVDLQKGALIQHIEQRRSA